jgi:XTP/dITP diphosphohydrolase
LRQIVLATKNQGKIREVKAEMQGFEMEILTLEKEPSSPDVIEDGSSFLENALKKAKAVSDFTGKAAMADDSGLEVDILGGKPGVFSSRYSGPEATDEANIKKLLDDLKGIPEGKRGACFRCVIVLYRPEGDYDVFEDTLKGRITIEPAGQNGFGYDPVFFVPDLKMTVAQMPPELKNSISHRGKALRALKKSLQTK